MPNFSPVPAADVYVAPFHGLCFKMSLSMLNTHCTEKPDKGNDTIQCLQLVNVFMGGCHFRLMDMLFSSGMTSILFLQCAVVGDLIKP